MATVGEIVRQAYRQENIIAIGQTVGSGSYTAAQETEGVELFESAWKALLGSKIGENLLNWPAPPRPTLTTDYNFPLYPTPNNNILPNDVWPYPQQNTRLITNLQGPTTIYLKQNPNDGARMGLQNIGASFAVNPLTLDGNGMLIEGGASLILNVGTSTPLLWFFRADLGEWKRVETLVAASESPLPSEFDDFFRCTVAMALCPRYGKSPQQMTITTAQEGRAKAIGRYMQEMPAAVDPSSPYNMPSQSFYTPGWGMPW